jgi:adenylate cyclase
MGEQPGRARRLAAALRRLDRRDALVGLARAGRRRLPGDARYGDPLSLSGDDAPQLLGRRISALADERPSALRELGMGALQVWQSLSEAQGRGHGDRDLAILSRISSTSPTGRSMRGTPRRSSTCARSARPSRSR